MLNTIGPVWDGNEVWLITAGGAMFAAFPGMYATVFSALYLPLLAILFGMIVRVVRDRMARQDRRPAVAELGRFRYRGSVPGCPRCCGVSRSPSWSAGFPVDADKQFICRFTDVLNAYTLLGGLATGGLFLFHGAVFVALKTAGAVRDDALRFAARLSLPVTALVAAFGLWTQLAHGKDWTWLVLAVAVVAQLAAVVLVWSRAQRRLGIRVHDVVVAAVVVAAVRSRCTRIWFRRR